MEIGRGGACVPARVALQGRIHRSIPHTQCIYFLVWKRCCADVRAGTQAPPLRHDEIQDKQDGQDEERDVEPLVLCGAEL